MDVVREFVVEKLKGSLDLDSEVGQGTIFKLTIPLTLAIIRALHAARRRSGLRAADRLDRRDAAGRSERHHQGRGPRGHPSPAPDDPARAALRHSRRGRPSRRRHKVPIATIGYSGHRMGFIVDAFVGEQQIVIKPLGSHLRKVDNVAGVTILGAGEVVPILNVPDLMTNARTRSGQRVGMIERDGARGPAVGAHLRGLVHHARARAFDLRGGGLRRRDRQRRRAGAHASSERGCGRCGRHRRPDAQHDRLRAHAGHQERSRACRASPSSS